MLNQAPLTVPTLAADGLAKNSVPDLARLQAERPTFAAVPFISSSLTTRTPKSRSPSGARRKPRNFDCFIEAVRSNSGTVVLDCLRVFERPRLLPSPNAPCKPQPHFPLALHRRRVLSPHIANVIVSFECDVPISASFTRGLPQRRTLRQFKTQ